jgi:uncharacterized protein
VTEITTIETEGVISTGTEAGIDGRPVLARRLPPDLLARRLAKEEGRDIAAVTTRRFFHLDRWNSFHSVVRNSLRVTGLYWRGLRNAGAVAVRENVVVLPRLPAAFDGFTLLHITDLHIDRNALAMRRLAELLPDLQYDHCVLTGDYRGASFGSNAQTLDGMAAIRAQLRGPAYAVLGNHDSIHMLPPLEAMGYTVLMNECAVIARGEQQLYLAGIDDAHFFETHDITAARSTIPQDAFAILLSHTPETYREAAAAGFDFMLSGHTHGGQICLPGSIPVTLDAQITREFGAGPWSYGDLTGYTSVGVGTSLIPVRFNCPPEIVLHRLKRA